MDAPNTNDPIRITRDEALGGHVDDMLKRQMSLKGESGINRDRGRRWYYQNWFVFMFAGLIATVIAWSLLEPYMEDSIYIQDKITAVDTTPSTAGMMLQGTITVKKEKIAILDHTRWLREVKTKERREVDINTLNVGDEIGVYIDKHELNKGGSLALAVFLVQSPQTAASR